MSSIHEPYSIIIHNFYAELQPHGLGCQACGTAACATMAAGHRIKIIDSPCKITLPGGDLFMSVRESDGHVLMTGPAAYEFDGVLPEGILA